MKQNESKKVKGLYNSSITRVRPFFKALIGKDKTGESWLPKLLKATPLNQGLVKTLCEHPSGLLDDCLQEREYYDKILCKTIKLEKCFEYSIPPSYSFLEWALMNPDKLTWPEDGKKTFGSETQYKRECLFGYHGKDTQKEIMKEGLNELKKQGVYYSAGQWWAFEGFTKIDCFLETDDFLLGIEGKRTDKVSPATDWFPQRNQIIRNLEVLKETAGSKEYALLLMSEDGKDTIKDSDFTNSLPHYSEQEIAEIKTHYLGALTWQQACEAVGLDFNALPETIRDVSQSIER
ncbi:MAG TPA: hypothetical protein PL080_01800 [Candidatus Syntrophosphaera thermopropionivorans]|jgi:hypothetical protein|nr:hypothetical protein [Candidatus Syntrophosphaera thermopropionivorans]